MTITQQKKVIKKFWFPIVAPELFNNVKIGESYVSEPAFLNGKTIVISLANVLNDQRLKNINAKFKIIKISEKAITDVVGMELSQSYVRRLVKYNKDKIDQSFTAKTADGRVVRMKPFMITKTATKGSILAALRKSSEQKVKHYASKMKYNTLVKQIVMNNFQHLVKNDLDKIYPLRNFEIRAFQHVKDEEPIGEEDLSMFQKKAPAPRKPKREEKQEASEEVPRQVEEEKQEEQ
ncbi:MAG: hypothetical protein QW331_02625 [Candidatus Woesearchaeota archaeon]